MSSNIVSELLRYIEDSPKSDTETPVNTVNSLTSHPLAYRTFGGQECRYRELGDEMLETSFGSHYLLTMIASGAIIQKLLYTERGSCHSLYCDGTTWRYFNRHGLVEHGVWDYVDHQVIDENITMDNVDHRIFYSASKPFALTAEAKRTAENGNPVFFVDTDLILKRRHDIILPNSSGIRVAYGHLEAIGTPCYPDFRRLHFPDGYQLPKKYRTDLPAVNTCLMFFNDKELLTEWCSFFKELFLNNWMEKEPDAATISEQLLGIDQRTFPMIADLHGYWGTDQVEPFLDLNWDPPGFYDNKTGKKAEWHYYTLEYHPEHPDWLQDITHTWINKRNIERDEAYRNYQGCIMLELALELDPGLERPLRSFDSLQPYFSLFKDYGTVENMLSMGAVRDKLDKER